MSVGAILALSLSLLQLDPRDRLTEAIRETRLKDAQAALTDLAAGDGVRAARGLAASLPRARERMGSLLSTTVAARQAHDRIDNSLLLELDEKRRREKQVAEARERVQESCARALEGEKIYEAIRGAFVSLKPEAVAVVAAEADRTASWLLKCELYEGLGAMGAQAPLLAALEREKEPAVVATVLSGLSSDRALPYLSHPRWQVRLSALRALRKSRDSVAPILDALEPADLRFRNAAFATLVALTKTDLPPDLDVWFDWWKANAADFVSGQYTPAARKDLAGPRRTTFYDIPVVSSRVCFIIDRSGSMKVDGRFDKARAELKRLLDELPDGSRFNVLFFGGTTTAFVRGMRVLDRAARQEAATFIDRQFYESGTDLYGALERGLALVGSPELGRLQDEGPDTLIVLSDGEPTVGRLIDEELVARVIARRARYLRPVIHTVSLVAESRSLKMLAEFTGGECRVK